MKTVVIYDDKITVKEAKDENTIHLPIPNFMDSEQRSTTVALQTARQMQADRVIIYRR